ncbi:MAG TPA: VOC family protein [Acidimicrobiales bacterium]|nr:VOC family protein [Acidimicrobiales bacterium]
MRLAHVAIRVPDVDAAVAWYESVLGLTVLSPPYLMEGDAITDDMGELLPTRPVAVKAAIVGNDAGDHVIEVIGYPNEPIPANPPRAITDAGISHVGVVCDDIDAARARIEAEGGTFIVSGTADVARLRTTWFRDPWGVVFILMQKHDATKAYWRQY